MSVHHYFPRLRWKAAEWEALQLLPSSVLEGVTPIFNVLNIDWDYVNSCYKKTLADYLSNFGATLATSWTLPRAVMLDVEHLDIHSSITHHPLDICCNDANTHGKSIIPVYSPHYSNNYLLSVQRNNHYGVALKLKAGLLSQGHYQLNSILAAIGVASNQVDLIIDFEDIETNTAQHVQQTITTCQNLINAASWRNIIISATSYPASQAGIPQHAIHLHRREEWDLWKSVIQSRQLSKTPGFSDYPTASAQVTQVDPRFMSQYVSIRYSDETYWIFVKGTAARGNGWGQTQQLCDILVNSPYYYNPQFSWGDLYISDRAQGTNRSGGSKEWRKVAHTHHLTLVAGQLLNLSTTHPAI